MARIFFLSMIWYILCGASVFISVFTKAADPHCSHRHFRNEIPFRNRPHSAFWKLSRLSSAVSPSSIQESLTMQYTSFPQGRPQSANPRQSREMNMSVHRICPFGHSELIQHSPQRPRSSNPRDRSRELSFATVSQLRHLRELHHYQRSLSHSNQDGTVSNPLRIRNNNDSEPHEHQPIGIDEGTNQNPGISRHCQRILSQRMSLIKRSAPSYLSASRDTAMRRPLTPPPGGMAGTIDIDQKHLERTMTPLPFQSSQNEISDTTSTTTQRIETHVVSSGSGGNRVYDESNRKPAVPRQPQRRKPQRNITLNKIPVPAHMITPSEIKPWTPLTPPDSGLKAVNGVIRFESKDSVGSESIQNRTEAQLGWHQNDKEQADSTESNE